jgi:hypothetical protein
MFLSFNPALNLFLPNEAKDEKDGQSVVRSPAGLKLKLLDDFEAPCSVSLNGIRSLNVL